MPNDGHPQIWKFKILVWGKGEDFDSDFGATVEWLGCEVRDSGGNLRDYVATSASGIDWSLTSVPEPGPAAGGWVALPAAAAIALRRRVSARGLAQRGGGADPDAAARMRRAATATRRATS